MAELLTEVTRANLVESVHRGDIAVVNDRGKVIYSVGNPEMITYLRSAAKPFQALPVVKSGVLENFSLNKRHLAVITGSHTGEEMHCQAVREVLDHIGFGEKELQCGIQWPSEKNSAHELIRSGQNPTPFHNTCSGKHAGMLALAKIRGWTVKEYWKLEHPIQQLMLSKVAEICNYPKEKVKIGVDGCGVPVFAMPLKNMAWGFANLVTREENNEVVDAMLAYPEMVFGPDKLDTDLMKIAADVVAKRGAEAVYCIGLANMGWGIAIKIEDGSFRAIGPTVIETLVQLGAITSGTAEKLYKYHHPEVKNRRKEVVGEIKPCFKLRKH